MKLNLNADLGESYGPYTIGNDAALLEIVGSANIACGFHGGDPLVMARTIARARETGASIGAHPGYADLQGFGRRPMQLPPEELRAVVLYQLGAIAGVAAAQGHGISHVKPHGAMNNQACVDRDMAEVLAGAVAEFDRELILLAPALSELARAGAAAGLPVAHEIFADRSYQADGTLTPRSQPGAVLHDAEAAALHVGRMLDAGGLVTTQGAVLKTPIHSVCVHGDGSAALALASGLRDSLRDRGIDLVPLPQVPR